MMRSGNWSCPAMLALGVLLAPAATAGEAFAIDESEQNAVVEATIASLDATYVFPDVAREMERKLRARVASGEYRSMTNGAAFASALTADLREVSHDKHLHVEYFPFGAPGEPHAGPQIDNLAIPGPGLGGGFGKAEVLEGNIGYVEIRAFHPTSIQALADVASQAMNTVAGADALIVDLRRNGGGWPEMIAHVLSYVFDVPTHLSDIYERVGDKTTQYWTTMSVPGPRFGGLKPIYVLTSKDTFSGGEEFAYDLKALGRAVIVGETTAGGAHATRQVKLVAGFVAYVPYGRLVNPITHFNWEGVGVTPDIPAAAADAFDVAYRLAKESVGWQASAHSAEPSRP